MKRQYPSVSAVGIDQHIFAQDSWNKLESSIQQFWQRRQSTWRPFEEAREWARNSGIKSSPEWKKASKEGRLPVDIPGAPHTVYKGKFKGWGDWLGTGRISKLGTDWRSFEEAREWARSSGIKSSRQWREATKEVRLPDDIPSYPDVVYKGKFKGWGDWLGTGRISKLGTDWRSFEEAREWARSSGIKSSTEWIKASIEGRLPEDIPSNPNVVYKGKFQGMGDWLGTEWRSFEEAREWARSSGIKSGPEWIKASIEGRLPEDIPGTPSTVYKGKFKGWGDWLGTEWRSFEEAREWARSSGIKSGPEWNKASKEGRLLKIFQVIPMLCIKVDFKVWATGLGLNGDLLKKRENGREVAGLSPVLSGRRPQQRAFACGYSGQSLCCV
ncbi:MAG: hypothetical protein IPJ71_17845 [Bdellovibrionales bacterium]|nr:hypothetical protein [Bdellovibrionales bacterium]